MKNKLLLVNIVAAISILISSALAQQPLVPVKKVSANTGQLKPVDATASLMVVQQLQPTTSSGDITTKGFAPTVSQQEIKAEHPAAKVMVVPVEFKPRPAWMNVPVTKQDIKPVMPSTIIKTVETKQLVAPANDNQPLTRPKLAGVQFIQ